MTRSTSQPPSPPQEVADPFGPWVQACADSCMRIQQLQWEALASWQQGFATYTKDFWEQWACRFAGGAPIDV